MLGITFTLDWISILTFVVTIFLPVIVGLVTTRETDPNRKAVYLAALSAVIGFGSELLAAVHAHEGYDAGSGLIKFVGIFVIATAFHFGLWKPTGVSTKAQDFGTSSDGTASITSLPDGKAGDHDATADVPEPQTSTPL